MFVPPEHIFPDLQASDRYSAIREILRHLIRSGAIPSNAEEALFTAFCRREEVMSTGVGFGLAFPHVVSGVVSRQIVALGTSKAGIDFASLDGKPVNTIVLVISPDSDERRSTVRPS